MTERQKKREACYELLDIVVSGFHMYGEIYIPGRSRGESFPCICLFHGFPGVTGNDDLAQYFMRQGFVVFRPYHRGAWGSEGYYSFTGAVEDALAVATYAYEKGADMYQIDRDRIYLVGHSMGGQTVLNANRRLPFVKATVAAASFNLAKLFRMGREEEFQAEILPMGQILRTEEKDALLKDARENYRQLDIEDAVEDLKDRNLYLIEGKYDEIAFPEQYVYPFWEKLSEYQTDAVRRLETLPASHDFPECRQILAEKIADWLEKEELQ